MRSGLLKFLLAVMMAIATGPWVQAVDVVELSLEELMDIEVTTAGKKEQPLSHVAAAITVITAEDIRLSGATTIPELLRRVPGMFVGHVSSQIHGVTARAGAERFSNKLLVMIDGRTIYTPFFSGVLWEQQDIMLEDIARIEVIRGPGGALWGANAVNGIINIITRESGDTQGGLFSGSLGNEERRAALRYGFSPSESFTMRLYGHGVGRDPGYSSGGSDDYWELGRLGARADFSVGPDDRFLLNLETFNSSLGGTTFVPDLTGPAYGSPQVHDDEYRGGHVLGRWEHDFGNESRSALQLDWDRGRVDAIATDYKRDTFDVDFQHRFRPLATHELVWGLGYRMVADEAGPGRIASTNPGERTTHLYSAFAQDELTLIEDVLTLTAGVKLENNSYTGTEVQPSVRLAYMPTSRSTFWSSWGRAVRTPSRVINDMSLDLMGTASGMVQLRGSEGVDAEVLDAWELGYRKLMSDNLAFDIATYYHRYDELLTFEKSGLSLVADNQMEASAYGVEASMTWRPTDRQQYYLAYTFAKSDYHLDPASADFGGSESEEDQFPQHTVYTNAIWKLTETIDLGATIRYMDNLKSENLDRFVELDARLGWRPKQNLEVWVTGKNLLDTQRAEFGNQGIVRTQVTEVRRAVAIGFSLTF